jgi:hypothetical protein
MSLTSYQAAPPRVLVGKVNRSPNYERLKSVGLARTPKMQPQPEMLRGRISQMTQIYRRKSHSLCQDVFQSSAPKNPCLQSSVKSVQSVVYLLSRFLASPSRLSLFSSHTAVPPRNRTTIWPFSTRIESRCERKRSPLGRRARIPCSRVCVTVSRYPCPVNNQGSR